MKGVVLREYQENIVRSVLEHGSTLVILPTGLGKTMIAVAVIMEKIGEGKAFFLAPTRPLVEQHARTIRETTGGSVGCVTGMIPLKKREKEYRDYRIVCATPQIVYNDMLRGIVDLSEYSVIVFDEAHRAIGDYDYVKIAEEYVKKRENALCLGLTASPGSDREKIEEVKKNLGITRVETRTESDPDVKKYVHDRKVMIVPVSLPAEYGRVINVLKEVKKEHVSWLKEKNVRASRKTDLLKLQKQLSKRVSENPAFYQILSRIAVVIKLDYLIGALETQGPEQALAYYRSLEQDGTKAAARITQDERIRNAMKTIRGFQYHPKVSELLKILSEESPDKAIVFANYRDTASLLEKILSEEGFSCKRFIGQASRQAEKGYSQREQARVLELFRQGGVNILVATSIGEEGLDIPSVDLAVFYEPVPSAVRMIQRKGRTGRHGPGKVYVLMTRNTRDQAYYWSSRRKEKKMQKELKNPQKRIGDFG